MKGRFKDRAKQITLIVLFLIISVLVISLISGRINTQPIVIVKKDGLVKNIPLEQQLEFFEIKEIPKNELKFFKGSVITSLDQLEGKVTLFDLKSGNPVPISTLSEPTAAGQFAASMEEGRTVHLLSQAKLGLPPVQEGDLINIALVYKEKGKDNTEGINVGMLMNNVKIYKLGETDIYVDVSIEESMLLHTASQLGTFVYQVPGQKMELNTEGGIDENETPSVIKQSDVFDAILNKTYSGYPSESKEVLTNVLEEMSENIILPEEDGKESKEKEENYGGESNE